MKIWLDVCGLELYYFDWISIIVTALFCMNELKLETSGDFDRSSGDK